MPYPFELPEGMQARIAADEKREAAEFEAQQYEKRERAIERARIAEAREHTLIYTSGHDSATWRAAAMRTAAEKSMRNYQAELGSEDRPAGMWTGADGTVHRFESPEQPQGPRTPEAAQLARAGEQQGREFMQRMTADLERRQRAARKPVISRSTEVRCIECSEREFDAEQSFLLHNDPRFGEAIPEVVVPDHVPASRKRSGTGWPELVR